MGNLSKLRIPLFLLAACLLILSACSKKAPEVVEVVKGNGDQQQTEEPLEEEPQEEAEVFFQFPLTGEKTSEEPQGRAVAAMINNQPEARPQTGLSKADIVYEVLSEGSITRFLAIYQSEKPENMGPIRSSRDYFIELAQGYDALYIAHGYSPDAQKMLFSGKYDNLNGMQHDGTLFKRASFRKAPHNSYITYENVEKGAEKAGYEMTIPPAKMEFLDEDKVENIQGAKVGNLKIAYDSSQFLVEYQFDQESGKYSRYSGGVQTSEYETEVPVLMDNIIVIETAHQVLDSVGRRSVDLNSGGKAYLFQKGIMKELEWKNKDGRMLPYEDGLPAKLVPGKTWINIVPKMDIVSYNE